jgi:hypothetical protein
MHMYGVFIGVILFVYLEREYNFACQTVRKIATGRSQTPWPNLPYPSLCISSELTLSAQLSAFSLGSAKHQPRTGWGEVSEYTS